MRVPLVSFFISRVNLNRVCPTLHAPVGRLREREKKKKSTNRVPGSVAGSVSVRVVFAGRVGKRTRIFGVE